MLILTTPGLNVLHIKRTKGVSHYCHIVHSLTPMTYRVFGVDYFDSVLVTNEIQKNFVRDVETAHNVAKKYIAVVGSTYLDELNKKYRSIAKDSIDSAESAFISQDSATFAESENPGESKNHAKSKNPIESKNSGKSNQSIESKNHIDSADSKDSTDSTNLAESVAHANPITLPDSSKKTILISPSWGKETLLSKYGLKLLMPLAKSDFNIIIRPHPQSLISPIERQNIEHLKEALGAYKNVIWDIGTPNIYAFLRADLMISDFSSVIFDFLCLAKKPILTLDFEFDPAGYDVADVEHFWTFEVLEQIGGKIKESDFENISEIIRKNLNSKAKSETIKKVRESLWRYPNIAGEMAGMEILKIHRQILLNRLGAFKGTFENLKKLDSVLENATDSAESTNFAESKDSADSPYLADSTLRVSIDSTDSTNFTDSSESISPKISPYSADSTQMQIGESK
ncbi:hypothetical protein CCY99_06250 [Helicobacter sp. 16-1353]|nr:hypothetical protein CCY99_06250 [Helicobacter sp. 16-1353]